MKRVFSLVLVVLLVCALGITAAGCNTGGGAQDAGGKYGDKVPGGVTGVSEEVLAALSDSGKISIYSCHAGMPDESTEMGKWWKGFYEYYQEVYNGTVDIRDVQWENWEDQYITHFASNEAPDLMYAFEKNWPKLANRGMIYSINEMKDKGVVAFDHPYLTDGLDQVDSDYTYKGECYTFAKNMAEADMIFVNETLFKQYSVKSPSEYYAEGTWNWTNFEKCAAEITRDTNADDVNDVFGYVGWDANFVVTAAGGRIITLKDDGKLEVTMDSVEAVQGFQNVHNIYGTLKCAADTSKQEDFGKGKIGMIAYMPRNMYNYLFGQNGFDKYTFDWSMLPYPLDERTNKEGIRSGKSYAWTVSSSSENPQGCLNFIIARKAYAKDVAAAPNTMDFDKYFTEEQVTMIDDCARQMITPVYQGVGTLWHAQWDFWTNLKRTNTSVNEHIATYKSLFVNQVALENDSATN